LARYSFADGTVDVHRAWTSDEVTSTMARILSDWEHTLPADRAARIVIKPNLNNDLVALTGNCTDLRVLCSLIEGLRSRGYADITVCDGSNVGIERRNIDTFKRLRVAALVERYGVRIVDLNRTPGRRVPLHAGGNPEVAAVLLDADFIITVPKVKTHAEAGLSIACKNWVGICRGQDKRHMHYDLGRNIAALIAKVRPHLIIVDGLVGMEGNGPGDGDPFHLGLLAASDNPWLNDNVLARTVGFNWRDVPYLVHGLNDGRFTQQDADTIVRTVPILRPIRPAPPRTKLAELSERRELTWLKHMVRPIVSRPEITELAYKAKIVQDVYFPEDDTVTAVQRPDNAECGTCRRCEDFCPTHLKVEEIGVKTEPPDCITCLYCWWVCPNGTITLKGDTNFLKRQIDRYKEQIEQL
jgi:uncharacterized protein (DUF362 family)/ferredoxin